MIEDDSRPGRLRAAVQEFAQAQSPDEPVLVDTAIVVWEQTTMTDDGEVQRQVDWAVPTDNFSISSAFGLLATGHEYLRDAIFGGGGDD
jgi:hypothetical protein